MIHLTRALVRRWLDALLHIDDTPQRTAAAFALGVFFGFSPFLGLHTLLGILFAFLLNVNRVAVMLGVYSNLPWVIAPYYAFVTMAGAKITGHNAPPNFKTQIGALFDLSLFHADFWHRLITILKPLLVPYVVGSTIGAVVLAAMAYPIALAFVTSRRRIHDIMVHKETAARHEGKEEGRKAERQKGRKEREKGRTAERQEGRHAGRPRS
jgi:uncharacterized protein